MKNSIVILICCLCLITGCNSMKVLYKNDLEHQVSNNYTYKFVGESEHFYFETGKVYYNDDERELLISNFGLKEKMDPNTKYAVNLYFNDVFYAGSISGTTDLNEKEYKNTIFGEHGYLGEKDQNGNIIGESDSFVETTKEDFKDDIKLEVKYCIKNDCNTEILKIKILEEK